MVHLTHAVDGDHAHLVVEVVLVHEAFVEHDLEQEGDLVHIDGFELAGLEI